MIGFESLQGKSIALIVWNTEKEDDVHVYKGEIVREVEVCRFINQSQNWQFSLTDETLERISEVPEKLKRILLDADFQMTVSIGNLPDDSTEGFIPSGMKWD